MKTIIRFAAIFGLVYSSLMGAHAQKPDRSKPPELGPAPSLTLPPIQHLKLANGLPIVWMEKHQVPLVQINLIVKAGTANDPADQRGLQFYQAPRHHH